MIERKFIAQRIKEKQIQDYIAGKASGYNKIDVKKTPLGEKIIIHTVRPGLIVGIKGENIKELTETLKKSFGMENPQIEVEEIRDPRLDSHAVADKIAYTLERFGPKRFKFIGYEMLTSVMNAGVMGVEIVIGGRGVPGARAKSWRFSAGYLKKSGDVSVSQVDRSIAIANLKSGTIGIKVSIMLPGTMLPDKVKIKEEKKEETKVEKKKEEKEETPEKPKKEKRKGSKIKNVNNQKE